MSIQTAIYSRLAGSEQLRGLLAASTINPAQPAIYEQWAPPDTPMPYINLTYATNEGSHWGKRDTTLIIDIFTDKDSTNAEAIKNKLLTILDRQKIDLEHEHQARVHSNRDQQIQEPEPYVTHWEIEFSVYYWRKAWLADW